MREVAAFTHRLLGDYEMKSDISEELRDPSAIRSLQLNQHTSAFHEGHAIMGQFSDEQQSEKFLSSTKNRTLVPHILVKRRNTRPC